MSIPNGPIWMVPRRRDPSFVGRGVEITDLESALAATGRSSLTQPAVLHGLGGVGKTLLAAEFAHRHANDYDAVLWHAVEDPNTLASAFADLAHSLGLPEATDPDQGAQTAAVLRWLETRPRWLLVFDNAERREDVEPYVPRRHTGHVLITSRNADWLPLARAIPIRPLPRADAIALLRGDQGWGDGAEADRLAEALGELPLALAQAAAYVRETACPFAAYLEEFQARYASFDREQRAEPGYGRTIAATLALALDKLKGTDQEGNGPAEVLLARCAFYAPNRIPRGLLADESLDAETLGAGLLTLRRYSLVETESGAVTVHRLVKIAVRDRLTLDEQTEYAEHAIQKLCVSFPEEPQDVKNWPECRKLVDHALNTIDRATDLQVSVTGIAELLDRVGIYFRAYQDLTRARTLLLHSLGIKESSYGPSHPLVARTLTNLGNVAQDQGDLVGARQYHERALRINESSYGTDHPQVAVSLAWIPTEGKLANNTTLIRLINQHS
jgi:tetratricopeptide (TPR) repeat protein